MTSKKKRGGLGRGMDALFQGLEETPGENEYIQEIPFNEIRSNHPALLSVNYYDLNKK